LPAIAGDEVMAVWQRGLLEDRVCSCGVAFSACPYWQQVVATSPGSFDAETAARVVAEIHRVMGVLGPLRVCTRRGRAALLASVPDFWFDAVGALYRGIATVSGSDTIVDTSKAPVLAWLLAHVPGASVRTVLVVRDPRAVARSWSRPPSLPDGAHELPVLAPWKTAIVWLLCNEASARVQRALAGPTRAPAVVVRFEDFTADPRGELVRVMGALGATPADLPDPLVMGGATGETHTMSGHPDVRFARGAVSVRPAAGTASGRAGSILVPLIDAPLLRRYGYATRGAS
jgi:hypothetical protein